MNEVVIHSIAFAGFIMLLNFAMWEGNVLEWYHNWLESLRTDFVKPFGLCSACTGFWFSSFYLKHGLEKWAVFVGISQMLLIIYTLILIQISKNK